MHLWTVVDGVASSLLFLCACAWEVNMLVIIRHGRVVGSANGAETAVPIWSGVWGILWGLSELVRWSGLVMEGQLPVRFGVWLRVFASLAAAYTILRLTLLGPYLAKLLESWRRAGPRRAE